VHSTYIPYWIIFPTQVARMMIVEKEQLSNNGCPFSLDINK
jgi:hypothetical protein